MVLYTARSIAAREIKMNTLFQECLFVECVLGNGEKLLVTLIYRSDSGSLENNDNLIELIKEACGKGYSRLLIMGDFNYPDTDWATWNVGSEDSAEAKILNCFQDNYLYQHVDRPTRIRGCDRPSVLDLILSNDDYVTDLEYQSKLGKSDHVVLTFKYN